MISSYVCNENTIEHPVELLQPLPEILNIFEIKKQL